jgi:hypothetical protein
VAQRKVTGDKARRSTDLLLAVKGVEQSSADLLGRVRSAAIAEKGSNVSHSTRPKCAIFGPEVKPANIPSVRWVSRPMG